MSSDARFDWLAGNWAYWKKIYFDQEVNKQHSSSFVELFSRGILSKKAIEDSSKQSGSSKNTRQLRKPTTASRIYMKLCTQQKKTCITSLENSGLFSSLSNLSDMVAEK